MNINKVSKRFKRSIKGQVTYESVERYIIEKGYSVILFDDNTEEIHTLGLKKIASEQIAFTYKDNVNIIFIRRSCMEHQKLHLLLHEIGHIELNHFDYHASNSEEKEYQANRFAQLVMDEKHYKIPNIVFMSLLIASVCCNIFMLAVFFRENKLTSSVNDSFESIEQKTNDTSPPSVHKVYYVTKTGTKYHDENCMYAKNAFPIDVETAQAIYSPCSRCCQ